MTYTLPELSYAYDALEPYIDARTMEIHHTKHHQAYTDKMNAVLAKHPELSERPLEELMRGYDTLPMDDADKRAFRNHGGGYLNHMLFWKVMDPAQKPDATLRSEIEATFGSFDAYKQQFNAHALNQFGSGWAWLVRDASGALMVYGTANQDSPLLQGHTPLLGLDVWEHAYYLKYQNRRQEYIDNWWMVVKLV